METYSMYMYLSKIGGIDCIRSNFKPACSLKSIPLFYQRCLESWSEFTKQEPENVKEILVQPIWNNSKMLVHKSPVYYEILNKMGINSVKNFYNEDGSTKQLTDYVNDQNEKYPMLYLYWMSVKYSLPVKWKHILNIKEDFVNISDYNVHQHVVTAEGITNINHIISRNVYSVFIKSLSEEPTGKIVLDNKNVNISWKEACQLPYRTTIDTKSREFQFKIIHGYLATNSKLYKWKLLDSNRCSFCFICEETVTHIFCECSRIVTFYVNIKDWCEKLRILLPSANSINVIYGIHPCKKTNWLENHLLLLFKQIVYNGRNNPNILTLSYFKQKVSEIQKIEYKIAQKRNKLPVHLTKWDRFLSDDVSCI